MEILNFIVQIQKLTKNQITSSPIILMIAIHISSRLAGCDESFEKRMKILNNDLEKESGASNVLNLSVWNAGDSESSDMKNLFKLYCLTDSDNLKTLSEKEQMNKLRRESCITNQEIKKGDSSDSQTGMCQAFKDSLQRTSTNCVNGLTPAECTSVTMYTSAFYGPYNNYIRSDQYEPFKVFTALLHNAIVKLDQLNPIPAGTSLYRGTNRVFAVPKSKRVYFKQFTSTSLDKDVAESFGTETFFHFIQNQPILAAKINKLSMFPMEEEVLISPFEAFELIKKKDNEMFFKSASKQDLLDPSNILTCSDDTNDKPSVPVIPNSGSGNFPATDTKDKLPSNPDSASGSNSENKFSFKNIKDTIEKNVDQKFVADIVDKGKHFLNSTNFKFLGGNSSTKMFYSFFVLCLPFIMQFILFEIYN